VSFLVGSESFALMADMAEALEQLILAKLLSRPDSAKDDVVLQLLGDASLSQTDVVQRVSDYIGPVASRSSAAGSCRGEGGRRLGI
jgi:hypothetical protein